MKVMNAIANLAVLLSGIVVILFVIDAEKMFRLYDESSHPKGMTMQDRFYLALFAFCFLWAGCRGVISSLISCAAFLGNGSPLSREEF